MSKGRKIISAVAMAFAIVTFTTFASAQDVRSEKRSDKAVKERKFEGKQFGERGFHRGMHGAKRGKMMMHGLHRLDLTDAQKEQIRGLMQANKTANEPLRQEMRSIIEKKRAGGEFSEADKARLKEIHSQMRQSGEQTHNTVLSLLTGEQRQQLEQWKQERKQRMEERRQQMQERRRQFQQRRDGQTSPNN